MPSSLVRTSLAALGIAAAFPVLAFACNGSSGATGGTPSAPAEDATAPDDADAQSIVVVPNDAPASLLGDTAPAPDTFVPFNTYDAADIPDGGLPTKPGVLACGATTCDQFAGVQCCLGDEGGACYVEAAACPGTSLSMTCDEIGDCRVGTSCCAAVTSLDDGGYTGLASACAVTCTAPTNVQVCRTNGECPDGGLCVVQRCPDGYTYELCGLYTSPADAGFVFNCAPK
jgi:hypothetical protein